MPRKEGTKVKVGHKPPRHATHSPRNSWTAASKIARRRRIAEALAFREQGHSFPRIAKQMKISISTAHDYVIEALTNLVPLESAKAVLALELKRLDALLAGQWAAAVAGDTGATYAALQIVDRRARLLGLYPQTGQLAQVLIQQQASSEMGVPQISFILPGHPEGSSTISAADMIEHTPAPTSELPTPPAPPPGFGTIELDSDGTGLPMYQDASGTYQASPAPPSDPRPYHDRFQDVTGRWRRGRTE